MVGQDIDRFREPAVRTLAMPADANAIGDIFGQLLLAAGNKAPGIEVLTKSAAAFRKLGRAGEAEQVEELLKSIED